MHRGPPGGRKGRMNSMPLLQRRSGISVSTSVQRRMRPVRQGRVGFFPGSSCRPGSRYRAPPGRRPSGPQCTTSSCICMEPRGASFESSSSSTSSGRMKTGQISHSEHAAHRLVEDPFSCTWFEYIYVHNCLSSNLSYFAAKRTVHVHLREGSRYVVWVPNRWNAPRSHNASQLLVGRRA